NMPNMPGGNMPGIPNPGANPAPNPKPGGNPPPNPGPPPPAKEEEKKPDPELVKAERTNLLPNDTENIVYLNVKEFLSTPAGEAAVGDKGVFRDEFFQDKLGFSPRDIDEILRAESFQKGWALTVVYTDKEVKIQDRQNKLKLQTAKDSC